MIVNCFLDEPTSGLDPHSSREFDDLVLELKSFDLNIILVTHDKESMKNLLDRFIILENKKLDFAALMKNYACKMNDFLKDLWSKSGK